MYKTVFLATDICMYILLLMIAFAVYFSARKKHLRRIWSHVFHSRLGILSATVLSVFFVIALLDSVHYRQQLPVTRNGGVHYSSQVHSLLDLILAPMGSDYEKTYSAPFAQNSYTKSIAVTEEGKIIFHYERLHHVDMNIKDIYLIILKSVIYAFLFWILIAFPYQLIYNWRQSGKFRIKSGLPGNPKNFPHGFFLATLLVLILIITAGYELSGAYHVFGTTRIGQDVFYQAIKSIRTGVLIGSITTLFMLPFAVFLGISAGFFGGLMDDVIQYVYITLSSIPGVLLIAAGILSLDIFVTNHPQLFSSTIQRADLRLFVLCLILGITSWTGLCRLLRAETLKVREYDYVTAARALGTGRFNIMLKHILPNVMHIIIISVVLDFSGLVLAEAVLSYVGVGVDPSMMSWGNMINSARLELARSPMVWWPLFAAFVCMFSLVLSANIFSEKVRAAFDPRVSQ